MTVAAVRRGLGFLLSMQLLAGCVAVRSPVVQPYSAELELILSGAPLLGQPYALADLPELDLFAITPEMQRFARRAVSRGTTYFEQVKALHDALLSPQEVGGRGITYSAYATETPQQTFEQRSANCLSFTLLYVALARHVGIGANVNEVDTPPTWDLDTGRDMVFLRHVNVKVSMAGNTYNVLRNDDVVIDLEMDRYRTTYNQRAIDDDLAAAQFYSNRAMELLEQGDVRNSFLYLRKALLLNDGQSYVWNNLGVLHSRQHAYREAEQVYLRGLQVKPADMTIMNNLAHLYRRMENLPEAEKYARLAQRYRELNPYYQYALAQAAFDTGEWQRALQLIQRAITREPNEARFYELAAGIYRQLGNAAMMKSMQSKQRHLQATWLDPVYQGGVAR